MGGNVTLELPKNMKWAFGANRTFEPELTDKELGHVVGTRPPARWMNWIQNLLYEQTKANAGTIIGTIHQATRTAGTSISMDACAGRPFMDVSGVVAESYFSTVMVIQDSDAYYSFDAGRTWSLTALALPSTTISYRRCLTIDQTGRFITTAANGNAYYSDLTSGWTAVTGLAISTPTALETRYPDGDDVILAGDGGGIKFGTSITGTLSAPTTAPSYIETGTDREACSIMRTGDNSFMLVTKAGEVFNTTNNGDDWSSASRTTITTVKHAAFNRDTGRAIVIGTDSSSRAAMETSDNNGGTWTAVSGLPSMDASDGECIYCTGGDMWMSSVNQTPGTNYIFGSVDDGDTWHQISIDRTYDNGILDFGCTGKEVLFGAENGYMFRTNSIVGGTP